MRAESSLVDEGPLIAEALNGSLSAFEGLVSLYEKRLYGFVLQYCQNAADAEELTQDAFVKAFQSLPHFKQRHRFGPWLFSIARNKCIDFLRAKQPAWSVEVAEPVDPQDPAL